jgi:two-component system, cell cycle sensor histidine kinase and response regulator CckA
MIHDSGSPGTGAVQYLATILLLEDEDGVRRLVTKVLESRGYIVFPTGHPVDALELAKRSDTKIDLLVTDLVLPEKSGREVAEAICRLQPDCRVLFMSGYTDDAIVLYGVLHAQAIFLQKPFRADELARKVAEALASSFPTRATRHS